MQCLICVGSTEFDELVMVLDDSRFQKMLEKHGFTKLLFQTGRGKYMPNKNLKSSSTLKIDIKDFIVLEPIINESDLVISHCGAGVLLECLRSKKNEKGASGLANIAVINSALMNNHQSELGDKLHADGHNVCTDVANVMEQI